MICAALIAVALAVLALGLALWTGALDTGCTGFQWAEWVWPTIHECCATHDYGGSDGQLLDCLTGAGGVPAMLALVGIAIMVLARPAYELWLRIKNRA